MKKVSRKGAKARFRLRLVIDREDERDQSAEGYDLGNSKPWPLGTYGSEARAIAARNSMVIIQ